MARDYMAGGSVTSSAPEEIPAKKSLPPGFRFHPTDEELVSYYLKKKVLGKPCFDTIAEVDIYKHKPSDLKEYSKLKTRDKEWYFFSAMDKKYDSGTRMSRKTKEGYWKATGKDREVHGGDELIGMIKTLVFHKGRAPEGRRTNWVIHEYRLVENEPENKNESSEEEEEEEEEQGEYVLCKLFFKNDIGPPIGNNYAAFVEEEWEEWDEKSLIHVENVKVMDQDHVPIDEDNNDKNEIQQGTNKSQWKFFDLNEVPREYESDEDNDDDESHKRKYVEEALPLCVLNKEASLPPVQYKRKRRSSGNYYSSQTTQDHGSSETTESLKLDLMKAETMIKFLQGEMNALREENEKLSKNSSSSNNNYYYKGQYALRKRT